MSNGADTFINLPTLSDERAMLDFPNVRNSERDALLSLVDLKSGMRVLDVQSASGYLSQEIYQRLKGNVECLCLEPSDALRARLPGHFVAISNPVENFFSLENETVDLVLGLVGLHHSESHFNTISESYRVLKQQGNIAFCEVVEGSNIACWLNEFVNQHSASGHKGRFVEQGAMASLFEAVGFVQIEESIKQVPWKFSQYSDIPPFFKGLFGLQCEESLIASAIRHYFTIDETSTGVELDWRLSYCCGMKPESHK